MGPSTKNNICKFNYLKNIDIDETINIVNRMLLKIQTANIFKRMILKNRYPRTRDVLCSFNLLK